MTHDPPAGNRPAHADAQAAVSVTEGMEEPREPKDSERHRRGGCRPGRKQTLNDALPDTRQDWWGYAGSCFAFAECLCNGVTFPRWQFAFRFARMLKMHPESARYTAANIARAVVKSRPGWVGFMAPTPDDFEARFVDAWESIRIPIGAHPLDAAVQLADEIPLELSPAVRQNRPTAYPRFVSIVGWLCVVSGEPLVTLPCREIAERMGVQAMTVSRYRKFAAHDGYLVQTAKHVRPGEGRGPGRATEFRFAYDRFPVLRERMGEKA